MSESVRVKIGSCNVVVAKDEVYSRIVNSYRTYKDYMEKYKAAKFHLEKSRQSISFIFDCKANTKIKTLGNLFDKQIRRCEAEMKEIFESSRERSDT